MEIEVDFVEAEEVLLAVVAEVDSATEEVEVEGEEHQEVVVRPEAVVVEAREEEANSVQREAQRPSSNHIGILESSLLVARRTCW